MDRSEQTIWSRPFGPRATM